MAEYIEHTMSVPPGCSLVSSTTEFEDCTFIVRIVRLNLDGMEINEKSLPYTVVILAPNKTWIQPTVCLKTFLFDAIMESYGPEQWVYCRWESNDQALHAELEW